MKGSEYRKLMAANAAAKILEAEQLVHEICESYGDVETSACHPRSGLKNTLKTLTQLRKSISSIK